MSEEPIAVQLLRKILAELEKLNSKSPRAKKERTELIGDGLPPLALIWNRWKHESFPAVMAMETCGSRFKACEARWKIKPNELYWVNIIQRINKSSWCLGNNDRKWIADFDFLCRIDTHTRILEGKFDNRESPKKERKLVGYWDNPDTGKREPVYG